MTPVIDFSKLQRCFCLSDTFTMLNDAAAALISARREEVNQSKRLLEELKGDQNCPKSCEVLMLCRSTFATFLTS